MMVVTLESYAQIVVKFTVAFGTQQLAKYVLLCEHAPTDEQDVCYCESMGWICHYLLKIAKDGIAIGHLLQTLVPHFFEEVAA